MCVCVCLFMVINKTICSQNARKARKMRGKLHYNIYTFFGAVARAAQDAQGAWPCVVCVTMKKRSSIKLHTITNTTPQITHKVLAGRVRWAFGVWHALQAIRCQPTRDLFCCSCLLSVRRCDTKCAYSAHQLPTGGQPDRTTARFTASRAVR